MQFKDVQETLKKPAQVTFRQKIQCANLNTGKQSASSGWGTYINRPTEKGQSVLQKQRESKAVLSKGIWWQ